MKKLIISLVAIGALTFGGYNLFFGGNNHAQADNGKAFHNNDPYLTEILKKNSLDVKIASYRVSPSEENRTTRRF